MEKPEKYNIEKLCLIQRQLKNKKGFTLVELFIVITIIMIIVVIVAPIISKSIKITQQTKVEEVQKEKPAPIQNNVEEKSGKSL